MTRYAVILADPPWKYRAWKGDRGMRTAESFYSTMSKAGLQALRPHIDEWAARDSALFLWATPPALPEALELVGAWGFIYTTFGFTWIKTTKAGKPKMGMGWHTRANAEICLLAKRGKPRIQARDVPQVIMAPPREHSRKPDEQYARIERLYGGPTTWSCSHAIGATGGTCGAMRWRASNRTPWRWSKPLRDSRVKNCHRRKRAMVEVVEDPRMSAEGGQAMTASTPPSPGASARMPKSEAPATANPGLLYPVAADTKADGEAPATWVRVALFGDTVGALAPRLTKGTEVYCEGRLTLGTWTGRDGEPKSGLNLTAWEVQPMGQIGRRKPKVRSRDEYGGAPFDDPLRF